MKQTLVLDPGSWAQNMWRKGSEPSADHMLEKGSCKDETWFVRSCQGPCARMQLQEGEWDSCVSPPPHRQNQPPALPQPDLQLTLESAR